MKLSINLRNWGPYSTRELILEFARAVDESGLDTVWINERLTFPPGALAGVPKTEVDGAMRTLDPFATLAFLAAATQRIGLGTGVLNLPFRPALPTAKWLATVQDLSGGRMRLGVGTGWMDEEFRALGLDSKRRGKMTDESLEVLHRCFAEDVVEVNGQQILFHPRPARPPIYNMSAVGRHTPCVARCASATAGFPPVWSPRPCVVRSPSCMNFGKRPGGHRPKWSP